MKRGDIVQFKCNWGSEPTPGNTSIIRRVGANWADVKTPYGTKRVPDPEKHLKVVTEPLTVYLKEEGE